MDTIRACLMSASEAERYHAEQVQTFRATNVRVITAITMTNVPEAVGVARAAWAAGLPVVISFTVETDGWLPAGEALGAAIKAVDEQTYGAPAYYMINCAHPDHFRQTLSDAAGSGASEAFASMLRAAATPNSTRRRS